MLNSVLKTKQCLDLSNGISPIQSETLNFFQKKEKEEEEEEKIVSLPIVSLPIAMRKRHLHSELFQ